MSVRYKLILHRRGAQPEIVRSTADRVFAQEQLVRLRLQYPHGRIEMVEENVTDYPKERT